MRNTLEFMRLSQGWLRDRPELEKKQMETHMGKLDQTVLSGARELEFEYFLFVF